MSLITFQGDSKELTEQVSGQILDALTDLKKGKSLNRFTIPIIKGDNFTFTVDVTEGQLGTVSLTLRRRVGITLTQRLS